jgi:hypothetical protein
MIVASYKALEIHSRDADSEFGARLIYSKAPDENRILAVHPGKLP